MCACIRKWKAIVSMAVGIGVFLTCLLPLRALMNYHEEHHLFRWTGYYVRELLSSWEGCTELCVSFVTQFFYVGWLGALIVALVVVGAQAGIWWLMRKAGLRQTWLYPISILLPIIVFLNTFVPERYRNDEAFRESVEYDYLSRTSQWDAILKKSKAKHPFSIQGILCTNFALAMRGQLSDSLFQYPQTGPEGLITDAQQEEPLTYFTLSNIFFQLCLINDAERMAFNAKQYIPDNHKSGRLYRRLAETNLINADYVIAAKYLHALESTLFYGQWARSLMAHIDDEAYMDSVFREKREQRLTDAEGLIPPRKDEVLMELVRRNPNNLLALDYLKAYEMLRIELYKSNYGF